MEHIAYNMRLKTFPDGSLRFYKSSKTYHRMGDEEREMLALFKKEFPDREWCEYAGDIQVVGDLAYWWEHCGKKNYDGHSIPRGEMQNRKRAVQKVYDLARSNQFDYFVTFTFDPAKVDSFVYESCCAALALWLDTMRKRGVMWLVVPEQHESGRWHFHALVKGNLDLVPAVNPYTGEFMFDKSGRQIFNCGNYSWGFTEATIVGDGQKTASYISKYLLKGSDVPKGKQRYWASKKLQKPVESFHDISDSDFGDFADRADFFKDCSNQYGRFMIAEIDAKE